MQGPLSPSSAVEVGIDQDTFRAGYQSTRQSNYSEWSTSNISQLGGLNIKVGLSDVIKTAIVNINLIIATAAAAAAVI